MLFHIYYCLYLCIVSHISVMGEQSTWETWRRYLIGSNCIIIESGKIPPYEQCLGCEIREAMGCLDDMRRNLSGTVPTGCTISAISEEYDTSCCPRYVAKKRKFDIIYETSAYPVGLACLRKTGCEHTEIYNQLLNECRAVCQHDTTNDDIDFTCTAIASPATRVEINSILLLVVSGIMLPYLAM
mmetsp:Transcript_5162/g.7904  ORF Transcript_5162/g.7904 Transcript_5162/m.7904 type:complete len:185 (-) Transcript_5162:69-623(-)